MKVLVTGANGQLGHDICLKLKEQNIEHIGACRNDFDLLDKDSIYNFIKAYMPNVIIHAAAYTAVDKAEIEKDTCLAINADATGYIADICKEIDAKLIYISTDYVFDGTKKTPYETTDVTNPINFYGETKLLGEENIKKLMSKYFIVRTSWVFGINGNNFVKTMLKLARANKELSVVCNQIGSPTYTEDLAQLICSMCKTEKYGTYHASNTGVCSWAEFAGKIMEYSGNDTIINDITHYETLAKRPENSVLSNKSLIDGGFETLPLWTDALKRYIKELK